MLRLKHTLRRSGCNLPPDFSEPDCSAKVTRLAAAAAASGNLRHLRWLFVWPRRRQWI